MSVSTFSAPGVQHSQRQRSVLGLGKRPTMSYLIARDRLESKNPYG